MYKEIKKRRSIKQFGNQVITMLFVFANELETYTRNATVVKTNNGSRKFDAAT